MSVWWLVWVIIFKSCCAIFVDDIDLCKETTASVFFDGYSDLVADDTAFSSLAYEEISYALLSCMRERHPNIAGMAVPTAPKINIVS